MVTDSWIGVVTAEKHRKLARYESELKKDRTVHSVMNQRKLEKTVKENKIRNDVQMIV